VAVGDAALRLGNTGPGQETAPARARQNYLAALFVAKAESSVEGALRVAEAFAALGDEEPALQSLRVSDALGSPADAALQGRRQALRERLSRGSITTGFPEAAGP
jgi:hypothetical protein